VLPNKGYTLEQNQRRAKNWFKISSSVFLIRKILLKSEIGFFFKKREVILKVFSCQK
jgi:hypothetical protein